MFTLLCIVLGLAALYCFSMWIYAAYRSVTQNFSDAALATIELYTFHLGLCGITAVGFLLLALKGS